MLKKYLTKNLYNKVKSGAIVAEVIKLNPSFANFLLHRNFGNRDISNSELKNAVDAIKLKNWKLNGQPIIISKTMRLLDGQHRLIAIIQSNTTIEILVVWNIEDDTFDTIDSGKKRSNADVLVCSGIPSRIARPLAVCTKHELSYRKNGLISGTHFFSRSIKSTHIYDEVMKNDKLREAVEFILTFKVGMLPMQAGGLAFLIYRFSCFHQEMSRKWMTDFIQGSDLAQNDARLWVRNRIISDKTFNRNQDIVIKMSYIIKAWHSQCYGRELKTSYAIFRDPKRHMKLISTDVDNW